jgi:hypothetical protein
MKKNYLKLIVAIVLASNVFAQNIPSYVPTNGLVGWWPFNGNANDESGNGNNGVVNGATLTTDRNGKANRAYSFNGNKQNITASKLINGSNELTISCWIYLTDNSNKWGSFITQNQPVYPFNTVFQGSIKSTSNTTINTLYYSKNNCSGSQQVYDTTSILNNNWHNFTYVINNNSECNVYIDGIFSKSLNGSGFSFCTQTNGVSLRIGGQWVNNDPQWFIGNIDDIAIYNRALTEQEVKTLYTGTPLCVSPTSIITPQGNTTFCQGGFVNLKATEGDNYSYEWFNNSQLITGATQSVYQASTNGFYTVKVKDGACSATSNSVPVTVNPNPIAKITPDGPTAFCEGGAVNLVASGGTTYKWNSGSLSPSIKVTQTGTYYVNVINSYGCSVNKSYDVNVYPNPTVSITPIPQFIIHNNGSIKLTATPAGGAFKGEGVTGTSFNPSNIGLGKKTIYYNYTSTQGCSGSAKLQTIVVDSIGTKCTSYDTVTITNTINDTVGILKIKFQLTTGINANQFTSVSVYPNPTSDVLIIDASDVQALNGYRYKMIDALGKTVYNELVSAAKTEISLKTFGKAGVYILHVVDANNASIETRQIVLE